MFQQGNIQPRIARVTMNFLTQKIINILQLPSNPPALNPIKHLWDEIDRRIRQRQPPSQSLDQLSQALQHDWQRIPQTRIQNLIRSMPRRCRTMLAADGGHKIY